MVSSKHIWREEISYKEPRYKITLEDQKIKDILSESSARRDAAFENMLKIIKIKSKQENSTYFYQFILYAELAKFLDNIDTWVTVETKWKEIMYDTILKYNIEKFAKIISTCGNENPKSMKKAREQVLNYLCNKRDKFAKLAGYTSEEISLLKKIERFDTKK